MDQLITYSLENLVIPIFLLQSFSIDAAGQFSSKMKYHLPSLVLFVV